jgi:hypothetical protein
MGVFRFLLFALLGASAIAFAFYIGTGQARYRRWGLVILKWTVIAALAFFGVMIIGRVV